MYVNLLQNMLFQFEEEFEHLFLCDIYGIFHGSGSHHLCDACIQTCPTCSSVFSTSMFRHTAAPGTSQGRYKSNVSVSTVFKSCECYTPHLFCVMNVIVFAFEFFKIVMITLTPELSTWKPFSVSHLFINSLFFISG